VAQSNQKVAIVCDWLIGGGAEKVALALHETYPDATIYTSYCTDEWRQKLNNKVVTGYLQYWPFSKLRKYLPVLRIMWFSRLNLKDYDLVISSSGNGEAKGVKKLKPDAKHVCYCHTPTHFYWDKYDEYIKNPGFRFFDPLARIALKILVGPLRKWDYNTAQRPDYFIANSTHIQQKIQQYYNRDSVVIHPPVNIERFKNWQNTKRSGFVTIGRQTPYKRTDIIVQACTELNLPLKVLGYGPEHEKLKKMAGDSVKFIHNPPDSVIEETLASSTAFIFAVNEDFGITPIEALASGTPLIAYKAGGALDYVTNSTGMFFSEQSVESLKQTLQTFDTSNFDTQKLRAFAETFSVDNFKSKIQQFITDKSV
jgi:glycosyltransferase involved in cell wall biosynthesis